jgi:hypothetical protein
MKIIITEQKTIVDNKKDPINVLLSLTVNYNGEFSEKRLYSYFTI